MTQPPPEHPTTPAGSSSPTSSPSPSPSAPSAPAGVRAPLLGIRTPRFQPATFPTPSSPTSGTAAEPAEPSSGTAGAPPSDPLEAATGTRSYPDDPAAEPDAGVPLKLARRPLEDVIRGLVLGAGVAAHHQLTRTDAERDAGLYLMDEDEAAAIGDPLAKIAGRRAGGQLVNPDAGDLIAAGIAAATYLIRNAVQSFRIRRALRAAGYTITPEQEETAA